MTQLLKALCITLITLTPLAYAEESNMPRPPWLHPEVLQAALEIGLDDIQGPQFRTAVTAFLENFNSDARRVLNRGGMDMERKIASRRRGRVKKMNKTMQALLTQEQFPRYEVYRDLMLAKMDAQSGARRRR